MEIAAHPPWLGSSSQTMAQHIHMHRSRLVCLHGMATVIPTHAFW